VKGKEKSIHANAMTITAITSLCDIFGLGIESVIVGFCKTVSKMFFSRQFLNLGYGLVFIRKKRTIPQSLQMVEFCVKLNFYARESNRRGFRNACDLACRREISDKLKIYSVNYSYAVDEFDLKKLLNYLKGKSTSR
jgi:hypothetical protein